MSIASPFRVPTYRRHKPSGRALVTIDGRDIYLGAYDSAAAEPNTNASFPSGSLMMAR
jgi:hypothetical protein